MISKPFPRSHPTDTCKHPCESPHARWHAHARTWNHCASCARVHIQIAWMIRPRVYVIVTVGTQNWSSQKNIRMACFFSSGIVTHSVSLQFAKRGIQQKEE